MILKSNFSPRKIWSYIRKPMTFAILWAIIVWIAFAIGGVKALAINFTPVAVLGSALAIFVAFRNNAAYARWWEARTIWGNIVHSTRVLARLCITFAESHAHQPNYNAKKSEEFIKRFTHKCIGWAHALRLHLRGQDQWSEIAPFLSEVEYIELATRQNKPAYLQLMMGREIYEAMADQTLGGFDSFQMEGQLLALANAQSACERIKNTPMPKQYDFFTRVFVSLFTFLLPLGLLGLFQSPPHHELSWMAIPMSILLAAVFIIMERTGAANENPFENQITDVPITALCNTIERDLIEFLNEVPLPEKLEAKNGYLF